MSGLGTASPEKAVMAIGLGRHDALTSGSRLSLPRVVSDLADYLVWIQILKHMGRRLERLPIHTQTLSQYLRSMTSDIKKPDEWFPSKRKPNQPLSGRSTSISVIDGYEERFLRHHEEIITELSAGKTVLAELHSEMRHNYVSRALEFRDGESQSIEWLRVPDGSERALFTESPYRYHLINDLVGSFDGARTELQGTLGSIRERTSILSDYVRDMFVAASTRSNLELQHSMTTLTRVAVLVPC
jgi:hypothetical protein